MFQVRQSAATTLPQVPSDRVKYRHLRTFFEARWDIKVLFSTHLQKVIRNSRPLLEELSLHYRGGEASDKCLTKTPREESDHKIIVPPLSSGIDATFQCPYLPWLAIN